MEDFNYFRPQTITELKEKLSQPGARILAGGTDIVPKMRRGEFRAPVLVDTSGIKAMRFIEDRGNEIVLGSLITHQELAESPLLRNVNPALVTAVESIGCQQTRSRGTLGGNIANASPAADSLPPLLAYDARVYLQSISGERWLTLDDFLVGPGETLLEKDEFIHSISFTPLKGDWGSAFIKVGKRTGMAVAVVSAAVALVLDEKDRISDIRVSVGAVAPTAIRCRDLEEALLGQVPEPGLMKDISEGCREEISPITDVRSNEQYRDHAAAVIIHRALENAADQALGRRG